MRQYKRYKRNLIVISFVGLILLTSIFSGQMSTLFFQKDSGQSMETIQLETAYSTDNHDLSDFLLTGTGSELEVRTYGNQSDNLVDQVDNFNISALENDMYLTHGYFNFTFSNNFTTNHVIEDTNIFDVLVDRENYYFESDSFDVSLINGTSSSTDISLLTDGDGTSYWNFTSESNLVNFTISTNFLVSTPYDHIPYNRDNIIGLISSLKFNSTQNGWLSIRMQNSYDLDSWVALSDPIEINSSLGTTELEDDAINENLNFINASDYCNIEYCFNASMDFNLCLIEYGFNSTIAYELNITNTEHVALEFDLRGESSEVNGFYAWLRTRDLVEASSTTLNVTLYHANASVARDTSFSTNHIQPDLETGYIRSKLFSYKQDGIIYFDFDTNNLSFGNYFIVIKSDSPNLVYSLVAINNYPQDPGYRIDHQLKFSSDDGTSWQAARAPSNEGGNYLDASPFIINVTRGYMPSDFNNELTIQDIPIEHVDITHAPYDKNLQDVYSHEWGKGTINIAFSDYIQNSYNIFFVNLSWNRDIASHLQFDVSWDALAYKEEYDNIIYSVKYGENPIWNFNHDLDTTINGWSFTEFWYVYPKEMNAHNLYNPVLADIYESTSQETTLLENPSYDKVMINYSVISGTLDGLYSLNLTSQNYLQDSSCVHSYLNYNGTLWETRGFMYGDNISASMSIQDPEGNAPTNGWANVSFYKNGAIQESEVDLYGQGSPYRIYDFRNYPIVNLTTGDTTGNEYYLGYFWTNGTSIGAQKIKVFFDNYLIDFNNFRYVPSLNRNRLSITPDFTQSQLEKYYMLIATVNRTGTAYKPDYPISNTGLGLVYSYDTGTKILSARLNSFNQSENVINPGENVNFRIEVENLNENINLSVKLIVRLLSFSNDDWIIAQEESNTRILDASDSGSDAIAQVFDIDVPIPTIDTTTMTWNGVNAPIRKGGVKTEVIVNFDTFDEDVGTYQCSDYSVLINQSESSFEGNVIEVDSTSELSNEIYIEDFERDSCIYNITGLNTTIIANYFTQYYTSSYEEFISSYSLLMNSKFTNISTIPSDIDDETEFNISSVLATEFGTPLSGEKVYCQYNNGTGWYNISDNEKTSNNEGITEFVIKTEDIPVDDNFELKLFWAGNTTLANTSQVISIVRNPSVEDLLISFIGIPIVQKGRQNIISLRLSNTGERVLSISQDNVSMSFDEITGGYSWSIISWEYTILNNFNPGQFADILIQLFIPENCPNSLNLNLYISLNTKTVNISILLSVISHPLIEDITLILTILIVGIIGIIILASIVYARKTKEKISQSYKVESIKKARTRRGVYQKPSEIAKTGISKPKEEPKKKKISKDKQEPETPKAADEEKTTDFDSLLKEEGLKEKKVFTRSQLKKWNIDKLREQCRKSAIKFNKKATKSELIQKLLDKNKK